MKKNSLIKAIVGIFLVYVVLSWIIPAGAFSESKLSVDGTAPVGLIDLIRYPIITFSSSIFVLSALVVLLIGGFYAVLNKTGVYGKLVESLKKRFKGKEFSFVIISVVVFTILSSLTGLTLPLFVLVPFAVAVIMLLGYKKLTAFMSTIGAILVGNMASTYGFNINGYLKYFLDLGMNVTILYRIIFLVLSAGILIFAIYKISSKDLVKKSTRKTTKKSENKEDKEEIVIPLYDGVVDKKKSFVPMIVIVVIMMLVSFISMYNWANGLGVELFNNIHDSINSFEINGYPIFKNLIGSVDPFGYWSNYELSVLLILASLLIGWIYNLKFSEIVESFISGSKKMLKVVIYMILANVIFLIMNSNSYGYNIYSTIANFFLGITDKFNVFTMSFTSLFGGLFYNDFPYMLNALYSYLSAAYTEFGVIGLVLQYVHGLLMLIVPTSVMLVIGLTYLDIPYVEYLKKTWKYLLMFLAAIVIIVTIAAIII